MIIYDKASSITWPSGRTMTSDELREDPIYKHLFEEPYVLFDGSDGVTTSFIKLSSLKREYGVEEEDQNKALKAIEEEMERRREQAEQEAAQRLDDIAAIHQRLDEQDEALMELASLLG